MVVSSDEVDLGEYLAAEQIPRKIMDLDSGQGVSIRLGNVAHLPEISAGSLGYQPSSRRAEGSTMRRRTL